MPLIPAGVDEYDVTGYKWKQEDNWESISKMYYTTAIYADALREYNQMYPGQMSDSIKQSSRPEPGIDIVYIPPVRLLEQKHGRLIRTLSPTK